MENHCHPRHRADRFSGNPTEWALRCSRSSMPPAAALAARCGFLLSPSYTEAFQRLGLYCQEPRKLMERPRCSIHPRNWNFESISLQQTVRLSPGFASVRGQSPGFQPLCGPFRAAVVGRDAQSPATSTRGGVVFLSGHIPVPQCCGAGGSRYRPRWPQAKWVASGSSDLGGALSFDRLKQSRAGSVDLARRAADASAPAACLRSSRAAGARQEWLG